MTIDYYRNFIAIVEEGSILGAAHKLLLAQPALSAQLKRMERDYGALLLQRGPRSVVLTEAGRIFYKKAQAIVALDEAGREEIARCLNGCEGTLSLALPPTNDEAFISKLLGPFMAAHPRVRYQIHESNSQEAAECVAAGLAEIGFVRSTITRRERFDLYPLEGEAFVAVIPRSHELAMGKASFARLAASEICLSRGCLGIFQEACRRYGIEPQVFAVTGSMSVALSMARLRRCIALVPREGARANEQEIVLPLTVDVPMTLFRAFIVRRGIPLSRVAALFLEDIRGKW